MYRFYNYKIARLAADGRKSCLVSEMLKFTSSKILSFSNNFLLIKVEDRFATYFENFLVSVSFEL